MTVRSSFLLCFRMIRPNRSEMSNARRSLFGAVICIAISLIPLITVLSVSEGMIEGITGRLIGLSSYQIQIAQKKSFSSADENLEVLEEIASRAETVPGVTGTYIERQGSVLAAGKTGRSGALVRAVPRDIFSRNEDFVKYMNVLEGSSEFSKTNGALIGKKIAESLGLSVGDTVRLISSKTTASGSVTPRVKSFVVEGIVSCGYQEIDALWIFVPLESGFEFLSSAASSIFVGVSAADSFGIEYEQIVEQLVFDNYEKGFGVYRWHDVNSSQFENYASTRVMLLFVVFLIVLVASVNISAALVMLVMERRKEIAILKSLGASSGGITLSFLFAGVFAGIAGVALGLPPAFLCVLKSNEIISFVEKVVNGIGNFLYIISSRGSVSAEAYSKIQILDPAFYLEKIPVSLPFDQILAAVCGTILLSALVSIAPSVRAGKEKPLTILRKVI